MSIHDPSFFLGVQHSRKTEDAVERGFFPGGVPALCELAPAPADLAGQPSLKPTMALTVFFTSSKKSPRSSKVQRQTTS